MSGALAIDCLAGAALLIAIDGARRRRPWQMTIATMSALVWCWREMQSPSLASQAPDPSVMHEQG